MKSHWNRRQFLRQAATGGTAAVALGLLPPRLVKAASPNEKLNIAVIGCGGRGGDDLERRVEREHRRPVRRGRPPGGQGLHSRFPRPRSSATSARCSTRSAQQIDAVVVGTPDHTHAPAAVMAMKMGKHCYCEKPLAHSVYEVRTMAELAQEKKLATQMGTQIHAGDNYRRVVELVQSGAIGPVGRGPRVARRRLRRRRDRPKETPPVPPELDWDLWLGPAPYRPYHPCYVPGHVAAMVGLRHRRAGRLRLPLHGPAVLGPEAAASDDASRPKARRSTRSGPRPG